MPKQPILRPSYLSDAKYFRRLVHAIQHDEAKPEWWRLRLIAKVNDLITEFEGADDVQKEATAEETPQEEAQTGIRGAKAG